MFKKNVESSLKELTGQKRGESKYPQEKHSKVPYGLREETCPSQLGVNPLRENLVQCLYSSPPRRRRHALVELGSFHQVL